MNICLLIDAWEPVWGGGQTHVWEVSQCLVSKFKCEVTIYTRALKDEAGNIFNQKQTFLNGKLKIIRSGTPASFFQPWGRIIWILHVLRVVLLAHREKPFSVINAHAYLAAVPAKMLRLFLGIPLVFTVHGSNNLDLRPWSFMGFFERVLLTFLKFDAVISVSRSFLKYPNINKNISIIPNGVTKNNIRKSKTRKSAKFTFLWVGRFDPVKGLDVLIRAFARLCEEHVTARLLLVGEGPERKRIESMVIKLNLRKRIKFLGRKNNNDVAKIYALADAFVLPSYSEGQPITLFEAWNAKLPVIASRVGDVPVYVSHKKNGLLVHSGNSIELAQAMKKATNPGFYKLGLAGFKTVTPFTWEAAAEKVYAVLKKVISKQNT